MELLILSALSVFQSVFGVGVLLFGTPIFLLFGYSFVEVLVLLLPISLMISLATVVTDGRGRWSALDVCLLVFPIMLGTVGAIDRETHVLIFLVGLFMVLSAIVNYFFRTRRVRRITLTDTVTIPVIGGIHGLTNQGGGLLLMWAGSSGRSARDIRSTVAFFYGIMATVQIITVAYLQPKTFITEFDIKNLLIPVGAFFVGTYIFVGIQKNRFQDVVTCVVFTFGVFVCLKGIVGMGFGFQ